VISGVVLQNLANSTELHLCIRMTLHQLSANQIFNFEVTPLLQLNMSSINLQIMPVLIVPKSGSWKLALKQIF